MDNVGVTRRQVQLAYALCAALAAFVLLAIEVGDDRGWVVEIDVDVAGSVHDAVEDEPAAVDASKVLTTFGSSAVLYPLCALVVALALARRRVALAVYVVAVVVFGALLNSLVKDLVDRRRPVFADPIAVGGGMSFPSGHAMNSFIGFGAAALVVWLLARRWARVAAVVAAVAVVAIGATRVTLGVHYLSDVVGGWLLGLAWLALGALIASRVPTLSAPAEPEPGGRTTASSAAL